MDHISNRLVIKTRLQRPSQTFFFDYKTRTIKSKSYASATNNYSIDIRNTWAYLYGANSEWYQLFRYDGTYFNNQKKKVLEVKDAKDTEGTYISSADR